MANCLPTGTNHSALSLRFWCVTDLNPAMGEASGFGSRSLIQKLRDIGGSEVASATPEQLTDLIHREMKQYADAVGISGAKA